MRSIIWALLIGACLAATSGRQPSRRVVEVSNSADLIAALNGPLDGVTINLAPGTYDLTPTRRIEPPLTQYHGIYKSQEEDSVAVTVGVLVSGHNVTLQGSSNGETAINTHAGYGVYFNGCTNCAIEKLTITGGAVDKVGLALDGAVVVRESSVRVRNCVIKDNYDVVGTEFGIAGICIREGGVLTAEFSEIASLSARAIAVYNGGVTVIRNNLIEGGVDVSGKYRAVIERNLITRRSGINAVGGSVEIRGNIIENVASDGISLVSSRDAVIDRNAIFGCGRFGILAAGPVESKQLTVTNNLIVDAGMAPGSFVGPMVIQWPGSMVRGNTCYANRASADSLDLDVSREAFWRARRPWTRTYRNTPVGVDGRHKFYESAFLTRYGRWAD